MMRRIQCMAGLAAALAVASCAGGAPMKAEFTPPSGWATAIPAATATQVSQDWWTNYGSAELAGLISAAQSGNPDLAASRQRIAQARARVRAAGAGLYPTLDGAGSGSRRWSGDGPSANGFEGGLDAAYEVDLWGGIAARRDAAEAERLATLFDRDAVALSLSAEVAGTYFQYLNLNDRIENARRILDIAERVLALVEKQEELGAASGLEVSQQRGAVASLRANIPELEQRRAETRNALAQLLGTAPHAVALRSASLGAVTLPEIAAGLPSDLLRRRPDLRSAEAALAAASADVAAARAEMLPSIRLTGGGGFASSELLSLFSPAGFLANLASGITAPIFDGGRLRAQRDLAIAGEAEALDLYRSAVLAAFREVEDALAAIKYLAETERDQQEAYAQARRSYEIAEARYRAGSTDFLALLDAQRTLFEQEDALEQTRLARMQASVALYEALGGGWCEGCSGPI
jgi:outer membrane protein, multidrug efflux system